jgi:hypothetical protein
MAQRGPVRNPKSRRGQAELRKQHKYAALGGRAPVETAAPGPGSPGELPTCPALPPRVAETWSNLVVDLVAAGIPLKQLDSRSIAIAAGYEADLLDLETLCGGTGDAELQIHHLLNAIKLKNQTRKEYLAALIAIGGTTLARLRARIAPEEKPKANDDPWGTL